jgi:hypothetical protein
VETASTQSGKEVIFAWFEDKKAVLAWYNSPTHRGLTGALIARRDGDYEPLAKVPEDCGPIMVVASLTLAERPEISDVRMPISQIAIELYQPLQAGLSINGAFTPEKVKVPGRRDRPAPVEGGTATTRPGDKGR